MIVVLDTNILLISISDRSKAHWVYRKLIDGAYELAVTDGILNEYHEKIALHWHHAVAQTVIQTLIELPNVKFINLHYRLNLIQNDPDDNAFVDCAFASNAHYLVSNDKDFNVLKRIDFPKINLVNLQEFDWILNENPR